MTKKEQEQYDARRRARDRAAGFDVFDGRRVSRDGDFLGLGRRVNGAVVTVLGHRAPRGSVWVLWDGHEEANRIELWSLEALRLEGA